MCQIFISRVWHFGRGLVGRYIIICLTSAAVAVPPGLLPQSAITGEKYPHLSSDTHPRPSPRTRQRAPFLFWIVGKLLALRRDKSCRVSDTDICPTDTVRMHLGDMDINSLHIHLGYSTWPPAPPA